ncbi:glucose-methanol-choline oxidoreductase [Aspergillus heteromorphus CBS 117.55]|uniref:Glucose-methanol-choline oxidoreductase n=1 Tax=Aspergillus heteromorphus CBS 117.55 TaxID=1448321 RepID=A0A317VFA8_9EURO|nr:glucose-methanol-choline oxidoreductase [Aspergillus heteromorphus CBS 117.55]PWY73064.1 glucose-methanol-choline oxidoreductase [Aspergillus heteromorphus CBS 117.55]
MRLDRMRSWWKWWAVAAAAGVQAVEPPPLLGSSFGVPGVNATFDYIVVGGGTAGLTLATRLVEQQAGRVAVIEAGGFYEMDNGNLSQVPADDARYIGRSQTDWQPLIDWGYSTTPQAGSYGAEIHYARGKTLGGSSARNYMLYQRGTRSAYQQWADAVGDASYTFDNLLPFFEKSLRFTPPDMGLRFANATPDYDPTHLGNGSGPLSVTFPHYAHAFATWAVKGLESLGMSRIPGFADGSLLGQAYALFTINATTMVRDSSETSFLRQALSYPNYSVYHSTMAKKILFDASAQATAVVVETAGLSYQLNASREIILSGGVFGSPQLLLASGVGPAEDLEALGIRVVADRPGVGQNMQDHVYLGVSHRVNAPTTSALGDPDFAAEAAREFHEEAAGMYTNPSTDVLGWEKVPAALRGGFSTGTQATLAQYPADWPEVEYIAVNGYLGAMQVLADPHDGFNYAALAVALAAPRSRGNLTIASADTAVAPLINPNWLTDPVDIEVAIAGLKRARQFWQTRAMQPLVIGDEAFPGPAVQTDAQIEAVIRQDFSTVWHASCTCAMGPAEDPMAVVDGQGRVFGVQGLRVVDASIFPLLPPGHPQATVYALAEKIACDITGACEEVES